MYTGEVINCTTCGLDITEAVKYSTLGHLDRWQCKKCYHGYYKVFDDRDLGKNKIVMDFN